ncbi:unnamed protein product, partial [Oppiella nova]
MDQIIDENFIQMNGNKPLVPNNHKVVNKLVINNERRVLGPIVANTSLHQKSHKSSALQRKQWPNESNHTNTSVNASNASNAGLKRSDEATKVSLGHKSDFEIFCDNSDSEMNISKMENDFDITFDENDENRENEM